MTPSEANALPQTTGLFNYVSAEETRPVYQLYKAEPADVIPLPRMNKTEMPVYDCRTVADDCELDREGFAFASFTPNFDNFYDPAAVRRDYYPMVEAAMLAQTRATRCKVFDHNVRHDPAAKSGNPEVDRPVRFVHNDYTENSGPQRVRDIMGGKAKELLKHRFTVVNLWRPISGPVYDMPLAIIDAASMTAGDFIATDLQYSDRVGEVTSIRHNPTHRWFYLAGMRTDEALFLKCFDSSRDGRARYTAHSAFSDPSAPACAARESIEARVLVFFGPEG